MSKSVRVLFVLLIAAFVLVACDDTGDTAEDAGAAQQFIPNPAGYTQHDTDDIQDAVATTLAGAGIATGNPVLTALVAQMDTLVECYRDVGAFDAKMHIQDVSASNITVPTAGVAAVINLDRAARNTVPCLTQDPLGLGAQRSLLNPCSSNGTFEQDGDTYLYFYGASNTPLCEVYQAHFNQFSG